ncbi:MAG TPA: hypothetical protein VGO59_09045 [Verrucomicrobiae bacterium]
MSCLCTFNFNLSTAHGQGTAFTYQGELNNNGIPAGGTFDLQFTLFDASTNGIVVGGPLTDTAVAVSNGLFTAQLDFGAAIFNGDPRWLQIGIRTNGSAGAFAALAPLQPVTSSPYAIQSANSTIAFSANSVAGTNITGTIPAAQLPSSVITNNATGVRFTGTFTGDGGALTNLNQSALNDVTFTPVQTNIYSSAGTYNFTVPAQVTKMTVKLWGAGGGSYNNPSTGGAGGFSLVNLLVTPGRNYTVVRRRQ